MLNITSDVEKTPARRCAAGNGNQAEEAREGRQIVGKKGGEKIESSKNAAGERTYKITK